MNETLTSRQLRLVALFGLLLVVVGGYWVVVRHKTSTPTTTPVTTPASTTPTPTKKHTPTPTPVKLNAHGLPVVVARALQKHSVVVVSLVSPNSGLDGIASAEAKAGAMSMHAGFVNLDVFHQRQGTAILRKLGVLDTPAVLVVKRPYAVYADFKGFVDRQVVEQAVADAR